MVKKNCWEVKNCGRGSGRVESGKLGVCRAATEKKVDGLHGGVNGGRVCWAIAGSLCGGDIQGECAERNKECTNCEFYKQVFKEEDKDFLFVQEIYKKLK